MHHRLFTIVAGLSAVLCVGTLVLWVRSYWVGDGITRYTSSDYVFVWSDRGSIGASSAAVVFPKPGVRYERFTGGGKGEGSGNPNVRRDWEGLGFTWYVADEGVGTMDGYPLPYPAGWAFAVPHALPVLLLAVPPFLWLRRARRHGRRVAAGRCPACGYDLRATPGRCPECGAVSATTKGAA